MKIAYLISAHNDPKQFGRMVSALHIEGSTSFFVHVDAKTNQEEFEQNIAPAYKPYVTFTQNRYWVQWGGYGQVKYQFVLLQACIESGINFDRVFILTAQDYPLWSNNDIVRELENNPTKEYIRGLNITNISLPKIREKLVLYHFFRDMDKTSYKVKKIFSGGSRIVMKLLPFRKKPYLMVNGERLDVYQSSAYMCITMNLAKYIYNELKTNTKLTRYFKTAFAPDEMAIPTIIFNSPFKENCEYCKENRYDGLKTLSCITYFNYGKSIQVFKLSDYEELRNSGMMFARKFASGISDELMDKLDKEKVIQ